jgi:murein hydrolase activator
VRACISGVVIFAGAFRSYGDVLIVDGCTVVAVVAGLLSLDVTEGQAVSAGDALATVRAPKSGEPVIYFEVQDDGVTVDPATLIGNR